MAIPNVDLSIQDFALGNVPPNTAGMAVKVGVCAGGEPNVLYQFNNAQDLKDTLVGGPAVEAAALNLSLAGGPVGVMRATTAGASMGSVGTFTLTGTGISTLTGATTPYRKTIIRYMVGGAVGTMQFGVSVDNGVTFLGPYLSAASGQLIPHTLSKVTFPAGTYVVGDYVTLNVDGSLVNTVTGGSPSVVTATHSLVDKYDIKVLITSDGIIGDGLGSYRVSLDGGDTYGPETGFLVSGIQLVPDVGLKLTFTGRMTTNNFYTGSGTSIITYTATELGVSFDTLFANPTDWGHAHVVGAAADMSASASLFSAIDAKMSTAENAFRYVHAKMELPDVSDATIQGDATFLALSSRRVDVGAGYFKNYSTLTGINFKRSVTWIASARNSAIPIGEDAAWVGSGISNAGVVSLYRDENATPNLDPLRFTTMRTFTGFSGYYLTNDRMFAPPGSDYTYAQFRRVMDQACKTTRAGFLPYLNGSVRVNAQTGAILERDAKQIEAAVNAQLKAVLIDTGNASATSVIINRNANIISTSRLPVTVRVVPLGYNKAIDVNIGFENPALAAV